ncbi:sugar ABC transporter ATP-binding protein [Arthrobacter sp. CAL618]|uniref:sugar ABC transporter ATP-binding protein n=1 Tax=Arthrobacter sp. CAL618 TaxID=1055770 RepID=UPI0003FC4432|nr:sugar ABC transporter ATP-binding protein [Arthrobacter sp. CAL618]
MALRDASFDLHAGEIHALVGENGSGKSTMVKILSGVHTPDSGSISVRGSETAFANPRGAQSNGVATVFQEVLAIESQSVLDNLWLGTDAFFRPGQTSQVRRERATACLAELLDNPPALDIRMEELELSDRQACAIARALLREPDVLILDEATSALDFDTRTRLFNIVTRLSGAGMGVILITHRMDEIEEIGDRITVMRSGETVATLNRGEWHQGEIVRLMTGSDHLVQPDARVKSARDSVQLPVVLETQETVLAPGRAPISVAFRRGEIVGLAGLEGHGQDRFLRALHGEHADGTVTRVSEGSRTAVANAASAQKLGIAYVPRERRAESIFPWMSILENFSLGTPNRDATAGWIAKARSGTRFAPFIESLNIRLGRTSDAITTLSGGNQQKVIIARWLASDPSILLLNDPTRGIDVNAKRDLYGLLSRLAEQGMTVVMLSTEVDEHVELMDRVLVFREDELFDEISGDDLSPEKLVAAFFGEKVEIQ